MGKCYVCDGRGKTKCSCCNGTGQIYRLNPLSISLYGAGFYNYNVCNICHGTGKEKCERCNATGYI